MEGYLWWSENRDTAILQGMSKWNQGSLKRQNGKKNRNKAIDIMEGGRGWARRTMMPTRNIIEGTCNLRLSNRPY